MTMDNANDYCYLTTEDLASIPYHKNVQALWIIVGVSVAGCVWYLSASYEAWWRNRYGGHDAADTQFFQANLLSGALVSLIAVTLLYTSYPEPIEATLIIVLALSQASALGWLDFPPGAQIWDVLCTKIPDIFALSLTLYATWDAKQAYFESPGYDKDSNPVPFSIEDPWFWAPFAIFSIVNEIALMVIYIIWCRKRVAVENGHRGQMMPAKKVFLCLATFCLSSFAGVLLSWIKFASPGCHQFKVALSIAPCMVLFSIGYAICQVIRRRGDFDTYLQNRMIG